MDGEFRLLSEDTYKNLTQSNNLNSLWRAVFSPMESIEQIDYLIGEMEKVRQKFVEMQPEIAKSVNDSVLKNTTLRIIRDGQVSQGYQSVCLRWRNLKNNQCSNVVQSFLQDPEQPSILKKNLLKAERERIVLNLQAQVTLNILRQLRKAKLELLSLNEMTLESVENSNLEIVESRYQEIHV